ncbi:MAG: T9SS type A sorting domain-containing protein, partial [Prolixibacteraceae bacterium]|nr:T9SS type A sorting domain-containing protein [Prolixibacteraceae bacterium]
NNIYWDDAVKGIWDQIDSVEAPVAVNPLLKTAVDVNKVDDIYFSENLSFNTMCDPKISYIALYYADPNAGTYPDSWCVGGDGGYFPDEMDCSFSTSSKSYTAAEDGSPLGNLNYFPDFNVGKSTQDHTLNAIKAYPNPFINQVSIVYTLEQNQNVELSVFDLKGQIVTNLIKAEQELGRYVINWDGSARNGQKLSAGTYIYQIKTTNWVKSAHITILK